MILLLKIYVAVAVGLVGLGFIGMTACMMADDPNLRIARHGFRIAPAGLIMIVLLVMVGGIGALLFGWGIA